MTEPATKLSITVPSELARAVKRQVGDRGMSAFVTEALRHEIEHRKLGAYLRQLDRDLGPVAPRVMERARARWPAR